MKVPITFISLFFLSTLFLGFDDTKTAHENAIPIDELSSDQDLWARKFLPLYDTYYHDFFLFSDDQIPWRTLIHDVTQYFIILSLIYMVWERASREEVDYVIAFFVFNVIDFIDYLFTHNGIFFLIGNIPITWNTCSVLFYSIISIYIYHGSSTSNR